MRDGGEQKYSE